MEAVASDGDEGSDADKYTLKFHNCTKEDRENFYDPSPSSRTKIDKLFASGSMFCLDKLDWKGENLKLFGKNDVMKHKRIDLNLVACEAKQITEENKHKNECLVDFNNSTAIEEKLQETIKYLTNPHITLIYNTERINIK